MESPPFPLVLQSPTYGPYGTLTCRENNWFTQKVRHNLCEKFLFSSWRRIKMFFPIKLEHSLLLSPIKLLSLQNFLALESFTMKTRRIRILWFLMTHTKKWMHLVRFYVQLLYLMTFRLWVQKYFFSLSVGRALNIRTLRNRTKLPKNKVHNLKRATQKKSVSFERKTRSMNEENLNPTSLLSLKFWLKFSLFLSRIKNSRNRRLTLN